MKTTIHQGHVDSSCSFGPASAKLQSWSKIGAATATDVVVVVVVEVTPAVTEAFTEKSDEQKHVSSYLIEHNSLPCCLRFSFSAFCSLETPPSFDSWNVRFGERHSLPDASSFKRQKEYRTKPRGILDLWF